MVPLDRPTLQPLVQAVLGRPDAGYLLAATAVFDGTDGITLPTFAAAIADGYLAGLEDAGWRGDPLHVRLGFLTLAVVRWALNAACLVLENVTTDDPAVHAETERWLGRRLAGEAGPAPTAARYHT